MRIRGHKTGSGKVITSESLGTIGQLIYHFDYRYNKTLSGTSVVTWGDLSSNSITMTRSTATRAFQDSAEGMTDVSTSDVPSLQGAYTEPLNRLHDGSAFFQFAVVRLSGLSATTINLTITSNSSAGINWSILNTDGRVRVLVNNDSAVQIVSNQTAAGAIPYGRFILITHQYYGSGTGTNNRTFYIEDIAYNFTSNPTFGTGTCRRLNLSKLNSTAAGLYIKCLGAYNLAGKTIPEIDTFRTTFINALKSDAEYSGLTTP